jgi:hypothetical protein
VTTQSVSTFSVGGLLVDRPVPTAEMEVVDVRRVGHLDVLLAGRQLGHRLAVIVEEALGTAPQDFGAYRTFCGT